MIRTESLTKRYGHSAAVDDITLRLPRGSVVGLLGPKGAGHHGVYTIARASLDQTAQRVTRRWQNGWQP